MIDRYYLGWVVFARVADLGATYLATPDLSAEINPLIRRMDWRWTIVLNLTLCPWFAAWPMAAAVLVVASLYCAGRNLAIWNARP